MKTISSTIWCILFMFFSIVTTASALDAIQPDVISGSTTTKTATKEIQFILKVPAASPLFSRFPIATVNDDVIRMDELTNALAASHESRQEGGSHAGKIDYMRMLDRLINIRLVAQEATNIGLDELPEFKSETEENARRVLTAMVMNEISREAKADPAVVEKKYKEMVVEWKIKSVLFENVDNAKAMSDAIKTGKSFDEMAKSARDDKKATGGEQGDFFKPMDMNPGIAVVVSTLDVGGVSPVIKLPVEKKTGFMIIQLEDKRYPENPAARQRAEQGARIDKKNEMLADYKKMLYKTRVTINEKLLKKVDYESPKADIQKLLSDTRVLVEFKDGKTITVGALTKALQAKFFHGVEQAARDKLVNKAIREVLDNMIEEQLIQDEGLRRGIEKSDEYQEKIRESKLTHLFSLFIERVVGPDLKVTYDEMQSYYQDHKGEYTEPEMLKMVKLDFGNKRDAGAALDKLKKGADINWVRANAEGLVAAADAEEGSTTGMLILTKKGLPAEMAKAVAGAKSGDFRLSAGPEGRFSVLSIQEVIPARQKQYEEIKEQIGAKVSNAKLVSAMEDWFHKLRDAGDVKVYLSESEK
jgi:hypothetical protein